MSVTKIYIWFRREKICDIYRAAVFYIDKSGRSVSARVNDIYIFLYQRDTRNMGSFLGVNNIADESGMLTVMTKLLKQELISDAEEEELALSGRLTSMQKVPSLSDLSDPESSLGESFQSQCLFSLLLETRKVAERIVWLRILYTFQYSSTSILACGLFVFSYFFTRALGNKFKYVRINNINTLIKKNYSNIKTFYIDIKLRHILSEFTHFYNYNLRWKVF